MAPRLLLVRGMKHFVAVALLVVAPSIPRPVGACSPVSEDDGPHAVDVAFSTDTVAPSAVDATVDVYRSSTGGGGCANSCGNGFNMVQISLNAIDDRTSIDRMAYRFTIVGGQPPPGLMWPSDDRFAPGEVNYRFDSSFHGAVSFTVEIRAVDLNGNVGPATTVTITD